MRDQLRNVSALHAALALLALALGCAADPPAVSGFLGDYSQLQPGRGNQARLLYIDHDANFARYDSIVVDRVAAWRDSQELQPLAKHLDAALRRELQADFELLAEPRNGSLRLRAAVAVAGEFLSIEVEVLDATSMERLVAAVDDRSVPSQDSAEARSDLDAWADTVRMRLVSFRDFDAAHHPSHSP